MTALMTNSCGLRFCLYWFLLVEIRITLGFSAQSRDCKISLQFSGFIYNSLQGIISSVFCASSQYSLLAANNYKFVFLSACITKISKGLRTKITNNQNKRWGSSITSSRIASRDLPWAWVKNTDSYTAAVFGKVLTYLNWALSSVKNKWGVTLLNEPSVMH